jgi:PAS domain S-box-containing protein
MKARLRNAWSGLTIPLITIEDPDRARQAQVLASMLLAGIFISYAGIVAATPIMTQVDRPWMPIAFLITSIFWFPYFLLRLGYIELGALLHGFWTPIQVIIMAWVLGDERGLAHLHFVVLSSAFAAFIFSTRTALIVVIVNGLILLVFGTLALDAETDLIISGPVTFHIVCSAILLTFGRAWRKREEARRLSLKESTERYQIISELASDFTVYCTFEPDGDSIRQWVIGPHEAITGYTLEETSGKHGDMFWLPEDRDRQAHDRARVRAGEQITTDYRLRRKDGELRCISMTRQPVWNDAHTEVIGYYAVLKDITDRKEADEQRLNAALRAEQLGLVRMFVHALSHDFRNRLSIIESNRYLIGRILEPTARERVHSRLETIGTTMQEMRVQIANLVEVCQIPEPKLMPFDLNALLHNIAEKKDAEAVQQQVQLILEPDPALPPVVGDAEQIERALVHLVANALTHTESGGRIILRSQHQDLQVVVTVEDTGRGIPADKIEQIFSPFFKVNDARTLGDGGVGVGLTFVKMIADAHKGEVRLHSVEGEGSRFQLILPIHSVN